MNILVNNSSTKFPEGGTIDELLSEIKLIPKGIAVAINNEVIPKNNWPNTLLHDNDKITIIKATQGG